jgi:phosphoribosylformimino-5-aminoimidazole carboxamide ribotide isomerase
VDLDAALGVGDNRGAAAMLVRECGLPCQVGGGIRDEEAIAAVFDAGATRAIVGTRAIEDAAWLRAAAQRWPGRLVVAADVRDGRVVTRGWTHDTALHAGEYIARLDPLPLAGVLVTDVGREGRQEGIDLQLFAFLAGGTSLPLQAAGGVTTLDDLRGLRDAGVTRAVLGMALYTGRLDPETTAREFGS